MKDLEFHTQDVSARWPVFRITIAVHLVIVVLCAIATHLDHTRTSHQLNSVAHIVLGCAAAAASVFGWPVCPIIILSTARRRGFSPQAVRAIIAEVALCSGQFFALLPMVQ